MTTQHPLVRVEPDGTRVYSNYHRYRPVPADQRKYAVRKPDDPRAVRFRGEWFLPLELAPEDGREMPETRPDTDAYDHMSTNLTCRCVPCLRPEAERWRRRWRREQGLPV